MWFSIITTRDKNRLKIISIREVKRIDDNNVASSYS